MSVTNDSYAHRRAMTTPRSGVMLQDRPWGCYQVVDQGVGFRVKRICVRPGQRLSYQLHATRAEHWYVVSGVGKATVDDVERHVGAGASVDVGVASAHRVENIGEVDLVFIEVQTGTYFGEDDIERLSDDYGRALSPASSASPTGCG